MTRVIHNARSGCWAGEMGEEVPGCSSLLQPLSSPESLYGPSGYFLLPSRVCSPCSHDSPPGHVLRGSWPFLKPLPISCLCLAGSQPCLPGHRSEHVTDLSLFEHPRSPLGAACLIVASLIPRHAALGGRAQSEVQRGEALCEAVVR